MVALEQWRRWRGDDGQCGGGGGGGISVAALGSVMVVLSEGNPHMARTISDKMLVWSDLIIFCHLSTHPKTHTQTWPIATITALSPGVV
jgi:hypothetical protein